MAMRSRGEDPGVTTRLRNLIEDGRIHVMDGAMGTLLYDRGIFLNVCYDQLSIEQPDLVRTVHEDYVRAGAEVIETNTFGANPVKLSAFGLEDRTEEINREAAQLARRAAGARVGVAGALGPLGIRIEPLGPTAWEEAVDLFKRQVEGLLSGGVDGFILETFSDLEEIRAAYRAVRELSDLPVIAQMTVEEGGRTSYGTDVETLARALDDWGADVVGLNCSVGPSAMLDAVERMARVTQRPIAAQPNAGLPKTVGERKIYLARPDYMAEYAGRMIEAGARFVGGCCGTTPDHIKQIRSAVAAKQPRHVRPRAAPRGEVRPRAVDIEPVPFAERSEFGRKLAGGDFVRSVEILPPRGSDTAPMLEACRLLQRLGVDALNILDGPRAESRMAALPAATVIEREVGIETVFHYTCRDRNLTRMVSDLLGAAASGLRNILITTGDPLGMGPYPDSTAVFDIDSIGLTNVVDGLNRGVDPGGNAIGGQTRFAIGVAVNPWAVDLERELRRLYWKVDAGAEFAVTQSVFDVGQLEAFLKRVEQYDLPIIAEIWPLLSFRNAEFLANEVPGVVVPREVLQRMADAEERGKDAALAEGVAIARAVLDQVRGMVQGIQVAAPLGRVEAAVSVLEA